MQSNYSGRDEDILQRHFCPSLWLSNDPPSPRNWHLTKNFILGRGEGREPHTSQNKESGYSDINLSGLLVRENTGHTMMD